MHPSLTPPHPEAPAKQASKDIQPHALKRSFEARLRRAPQDEEV
jgi:hypothetical protein